jgi:hypothetical protein
MCGRCDSGHPVDHSRAHDLSRRGFMKTAAAAGAALDSDADLAADQTPKAIEFTPDKPWSEAAEISPYAELWRGEAERIFGALAFDDKRGTARA